MSTESITVDLSLLAASLSQDAVKRDYLDLVGNYRLATERGLPHDGMAKCLTAQAEAINAIHESRLRWIRGDA